MTDTALITPEEFDDIYDEAYYAWDAFFPEAELDMRFYLGDQWLNEEKEALFEQGRNAFVFNRIRSGINLVTGYQRQNRLSTIISPVEDGDQKTADQYSQCLIHAMGNDNAYYTISEAFSGSCITGFNLLSIYNDYSEDIIDGDIKFQREPWNAFIVDPYFTKRDFSDCNYIMRRKYISKEQAEMLLPNKSEFIDDQAKANWERDDKFTWIPYQRQPSKNNLLAYDEVYRRETVMQDVLLDSETNKMMDFDGSMEQFRMLREQYPQFELIKRPKNRIRLDILINNTPMETVYDQFGLNEYPFVPFIAVFQPESDQWDLKIQSLVRQMRDPQREANRRRSQMVDLLDSQVNSGYIAEEDAVVNPRSLYQSGQGNVIWKKAGKAPGAIEKIQPGQIPPSMFQLQELFDRDMMEILGVNDAAFGRMESAGESGVMQMLRQSAAITNIQDVYDNLRYSQEMIGRKVMKLISEWTPEKVQRVTGEAPTEQFYTKDFSKYDAVVQEGMLTDTQRQMFFRQLIDLKQLGEPIPPMLLARSAPIQGKSEYYEEMEKFQQQQQQAAEEQQKKEQAMLQAQMELAQSKAVEQMAGAQERFTRAVANNSLTDERAAAAIEDRSDAALNRVKAAKELESMDDDRFFKYLSWINMMEEKSRQQEIEVKKDDVAIAAQGEAIGSQLTGLPPQVPQGNPQPQGGENENVF